MLQHTVTNYQILQHAATHYNTPATAKCRRLDVRQIRNDLQHAVTHCDALQYTATHLQQQNAVVWTGGRFGKTYDTLQLTATHCNTLQHTCNSKMPSFGQVADSARLMTHCNSLQHTAIRCNSLQHTAIRCNIPATSKCHLLDARQIWQDSRHRTTLCTHCNTLQHTATHCNTLQHTCNSKMSSAGRAANSARLTTTGTPNSFKHPRATTCVRVFVRGRARMNNKPCSMLALNQSCPPQTSTQSLRNVWPCKCDYRNLQPVEQEIKNILPAKENISFSCMYWERLQARDLFCRVDRKTESSLQAKKNFSDPWATEISCHRIFWRKAIYSLYKNQILVKCAKNLFSLLVIDLVALVCRENDFLPRLKFIWL